ncbi:hypothetical protein EI71_01201 [Anaeroplasma bactoclasticum]|jgi:hypothetical protein|uniref:Uncharacterized protein n=1 Tax=Anaeroplasma bactoclasticum TaxID=2088 RepID=A0A397RUB6_9MOLU|nr:hypothetical protein EI71_01201 [Anaeroplasma bactoclasticum]
MKEYIKPIIIDEELSIVDVIAESFGSSQAGDRIVNFLED